MKDNEVEKYMRELPMYRLTTEYDDGVSYSVDVEDEYGIAVEDMGIPHSVAKQFLRHERIAVLKGKINTGNMFIMDGKFRTYTADGKSPNLSDKIEEWEQQLKKLEGEV